MARVRDLWITTGKRGPKRKTARHPDNGGDPKANRWQACWTVDGVEKTETFRTRDQADAYAARKQTEVRSGDYVDADAGKVPVGDLFPKWLALREVTEGSRARYESAYRLHVLPMWGRRRVATIKPSEVAAWSASMAGQRATRQVAVMILSSLLDLAQADGALRVNPARSKLVGRAPQTSALERTGWDTARIRAVARACGEYEPLPLVCAGLGLRESECFGLHWSDFDFVASIVHIDRQLIRYGGHVAEKLPKGEKTRVVPLPAGVAELVQRHGRRDGPLFTIDRKPILAWRWHRIWLPALAAADVIPEFTGRAYPPAREHGMHALRHWYSTALQDAGVSLAGVMEFLGHSRGSMPLAVGVYGHVTEATFEAARRAVDSSLFALRPVSADGTVTELRQAR